MLISIYNAPVVSCKKLFKIYKGLFIGQKFKFKERHFCHSLQASPGEMEAELENGLIIGHAYSITDVKVVSKIYFILMCKWAFQ